MLLTIDIRLPILGALIAVIICAILVIIFSTNKNKNEYAIKDSLMTKNEISLYNMLCGLYADKYIILPQINLASVIDKKNQGFRAELFRNADFGVFDYNFKPILLIELNDDSHLRQDRAERDKSVNEICSMAHLPLITIWEREDVTVEIVKDKLKKYLG